MKTDRNYFYIVIVIIFVIMFMLLLFFKVYRDGSILLTHGGAEMGQGLHTKMIQVASKALGVPYEKIHLTETATDKVKLKYQFILNLVI